MAEVTAWVPRRSCVSLWLLGSLIGHPPPKLGWMPDPLPALSVSGNDATAHRPST
ncbi:MAG: hypothetical protein IPL28_23725 [Chloroflexi bacterium]|nr:hypothetical protein [Chloroflexota bacterium]